MTVQNELIGINNAIVTLKRLFDEMPCENEFGWRMLYHVIHTLVIRRIKLQHTSMFSESWEKLWSMIPETVGEAS